MQDSIDVEIVKLLGKNARQDSETLAKKLDLSAATVRRRIKRLINDGSLRIIGVVDAAKFGLPLSVVIALDVIPEKLESAMKALANLPGINRVFFTSGRYDIIVNANFSSTAALAGFITEHLNTIQGLKDTETFICLEESRQHFLPLYPRQE
jgi:Lrp/AsnC family transcriptional regulator, regulator for asnA, asnC and gidA